MKEMILNELLKRAEQRADAIGYDIDEDLRYKDATWVSTDLYFEEDVTPAEIKNAFALLRAVYADMGLDMNAVAINIIENIII